MSSQSQSLLYLLLITLGVLSGCTDRTERANADESNQKGWPNPPPKAGRIALDGTWGTSPAACKTNPWIITDGDPIQVRHGAERCTLRIGAVGITGELMGGASCVDEGEKRQVEGWTLYMVPEQLGIRRGGGHDHVSLRRCP